MAKEIKENEELENKAEGILTEKEQDDLQAKKTAKKVKANTVRIKIPIDPLNPKDMVVPVMINGYIWQINRGETVDVPEAVANILEEAKYI